MQHNSNPDLFKITYRIKMESREEMVVDISLKRDTLEMVHNGHKDLPGWTKLNVCKCPNCPLDENEHPDCPVAAGISGVVDLFRDFHSHDRAKVVVERTERSYQCDASLQDIVGSLMGIYMVAAGCPILNKMRPLVETHLPFSTWQENVFRIISIYLFAQYVRNKNGRKANWELGGLVDYYRQVEQVNRSLCERLNLVRKDDGDVILNAISVLNSLANITSLLIEENELAHWENIFLAHWG